MPPKKESAEERANRLHNKAEEIAIKADRAKVNAACRNAATLSAVKAYLQRQGLWPLAPRSAAGGDSSDAMAPSAEAAVFVEADEVLNSFDHQGFALDMQVHRNHNTLNKCPPKYLRIIWHVMEPLALHSRMLRVACGPGQREVPRDPLIQAIENATGQDPNSVFFTLHLGSLCAHFIQKNKERGRRLKDVRIPFDWQNACGVYTTSAGSRTNDLVLASRYSDARVTIPLPAVVQRDDVVIEANWSDVRATLRSPANKSWGVYCQVALAACASVSGGGPSCTSENPDESPNAAQSLAEANNDAQVDGSEHAEGEDGDESDNGNDCAESEADYEAPADDATVSVKDTEAVVASADGESKVGDFEGVVMTAKCAAEVERCFVPPMILSTPPAKMFRVAEPSSESEDEAVVVQ